jgi:hypothetical protein
MNAPYESNGVSKRGSVEEKPPSREIRKNGSQNSYEPGGPVIDFEKMEEGHVQHMDDEEYEKYRR